MKKIFLVLIIVNSTARSQDSNRVIAAEIITIHSNLLNEDRQLYIYKPAENDIYAPSSYPVVYLLDGEAHINMVGGQLNYLSEKYRVLPKMIVVGIANTQRTRDLTPTHAMYDFTGKLDTASVFLKSSGGGEKFLQFIQQEVIPYVEKNYHPAPYRIFTGHSFGGLTMFHCLLLHPEMFNAYISISPSIWWDQEWILKQVAEKWKTGTTLNKKLFFSDGNEGGLFHRDLLSMDSLLKKRNVSQLKFRYVYYPDESHVSEPVKAFYDGIRFVYPHWFPPELDTSQGVLSYKLFEKHYHNLSMEYGYTIKPPEDVINNYGYNLLQQHKIDEALVFFKKNVENYPDSYNVYDSYGEALMAKGDKQNSIANYKKSLELNPKNENAKEKLKILEQ